MDERRDYPTGVIPPTAYQRTFQQPAYHQQRQPQMNLSANFAEGAQKLTPGGFQPLNREEHREAERIALEATFSYDGYQVARREFFSHKFDPTLTFKGNSITFNNACIASLNDVVYVQVLVNPDEKKLVIRPCAEGDRDAIRWCIAKTEKRKSRQITCLPFTTKIYNIMNWQKLYYYKLQGARINYDGQKIYIFDLTSEEPFPPTVKSDTDTKRKARTAVLPDHGDDAFGLSVQDHDASTQINLMQGYGLEGLAKNAEQGTEQLSMEYIDREVGEVVKA